MSKFAQMPQYVKEAYNKYCTHANRGGSSNAIIAGGAVRDSLNEVRVKDIDIFVDAKYAQYFQGDIQYWDIVGSRPSKLFDRFGDAIPWQPSQPKVVTTMAIPYGATQGASSVYTNSMAGTITFSTSSIVLSSTKSDPEYTNNNRVVEVYERDDIVDGIRYPLNLIFVECSPVEYVTKYFDFGICKTWYDGSYVHMHGDYTNDINNKAITMVLPPEHVIACYGSLQAGFDAMSEHAHRLQYKYPSHKIVMSSV